MLLSRNNAGKRHTTCLSFRDLAPEFQHFWIFAIHIRTPSARRPHAVRTPSARRPHPVRTPSAPRPHPVRTPSARLPHAVSGVWGVLWNAWHHFTRPCLHEDRNTPRSPTPGGRPRPNSGLDGGSGPCLTGTYEFFIRERAGGTVRSPMSYRAYMV